MRDFNQCGEAEMQKVVIAVFIIMIVVAVVLSFFPEFVNWLNPFYGN